MNKKCIWLGMVRRWLSTVVTPSQPTVAKEEQKKSVVRGESLKAQPREVSVGQILYERLRDKASAQRISQVDASTGREVTSLEFLKTSVAVAEGLRERGVKVGDFVMVVGQNSISINTVLTGIFLSGAVPVTVGVYANAEGVKTSLQSTKPSFYVCDEMSLFTVQRIVGEMLGPIGRDKLLVLDDSAPAGSNLPYLPAFIRGKGENYADFQPGAVTNVKEDIALVMKATVEGATVRAVGLTHYNLLHIFARYDHLYGPDNMSKEVILQAQKIHWMSGIYTVLLSCYYGMKVVVMSEFDEELVMKSIEKYKVTWCFLYPNKIWLLYKYRYKQKYDTSSCRNFYGVGSSLNKELVDAVKTKLGLELKTAYSKTELSGIVLEQRTSWKAGSIGELVPECLAKVISTKTNAVVGPHTPGELYLKCPTLMKGYMDDEKATRQAIDKDGFLHSGDYALYDEQGLFYFIEALRGVIRYKNYELSPQEIEGTIKFMDSVRDAVVGGIAHPKDGYRTIAFVVKATDSKVTADEIKAFVAERLEDFKQLKGGVIFVSKIPRSKETGYVKRHVFSKVLSKYRLKEDGAELEASSPKLAEKEEEKKIY